MCMIPHEFIVWFFFVVSTFSYGIIRNDKSLKIYPLNRNLQGQKIYPKRENQENFLFQEVKRVTQSTRPTGLELYENVCDEKIRTKETS